MLVSIDCNYCGFGWEEFWDDSHDYRCHKCNDSNLNIESIEKSKVDYYKGAPAFVISQEKVKINLESVKDDIKEIKENISEDDENFQYFY